MPCLNANSTADRVGGLYLLSFQASLDIFMLMLIIVINTFIIFSVLSCRLMKSGELWISRASSRFIVNLAAADLWVALTTLYYFSFRYVCELSQDHERWSCLLRFFFITNSLLTSACSMVAIAVDRYVAVVHALRYRELMSYRRSTFMIIFAWCFPVITSSPVLYWNNWSPQLDCTVENVVPFLLVCCVGICTHGLVVTVVAVTHYRIHREAQEINNRRRSTESGSSFYSSAETVPSSTPLMNSKSARTVLLVTGCYLTCWSPYTIMYFIRMTGYSTPVFEVCYSFSHTFANINYMINPFIYAWRNTSVKCAIIRTCKKLRIFKSPSINGNRRIPTLRPL
ncbi:melanocortin receptor 5 [Anabrus simplex]|uniref:melanocortin receptor 5 n=1 Tax=Anabrus simplex TaxID=316456 RepID=UPI0035A26878